LFFSGGVISVNSFLNFSTSKGFNSDFRSILSGFSLTVFKILDSGNLPLALSDISTEILF